MAYVLAPLVAWFVAGSLKFALNSVRAGGLSFDQIGLGRSPSTHTTIVTATAALVGLRQGVDSAAFGVALTLAVIVVIDAMDLRRRLERHAEAINRLGHQRDDVPTVRERIGHRPHEVALGIVVGVAVAWGLNALVP